MAVKELLAGRELREILVTGFGKVSCLQTRLTDHLQVRHWKGTNAI